MPGNLLAPVDPATLDRLARRLPIGAALVSATNGKTTTSAMPTQILRALPARAQRLGREPRLRRRLDAARGQRGAELGLLEVDEAACPDVARRVRPRGIALGNLFRGQLDGYGELEHAADSNPVRERRLGVGDVDFEPLADWLERLVATGERAAELAPLRVQRLAGGADRGRPAARARARPRARADAGRRRARLPPHLYGDAHAAPDCRRMRGHVANWVRAA